MLQHSSKWIGGQDVNGAHLKEVMERLGKGSTLNQQAANSGIYNIKEYHNMASSGTWLVERPTVTRDTAPTALSTQENTARPISSIIKSGRMYLNTKFAGMYDFAYYDGNIDLNNEFMSGSRFDSMFFTGNQDTHWALIYINGNLELDFPNIIRPPTRKLGMCIYTTGNMILNGFVSMTNRGANHSGLGISHGYTAPVALPLNGTLTIPAQGGAGGARAESGSGSAGTGAGYFANAGVAAGGSGTGTYCGSGGGASGCSCVAVNGTTVTSGSGTAGTCFSGGTSGAGCMVYTGNSSTMGATAFSQHDGQINGGAGGQVQNGAQATYGSSGGYGNPGGYREKSGEVIVGHEYGERMTDNSVGHATAQSRAYSSVEGHNGTAGTCVLMCAGTYSGSGKLRSSGGISWKYHDGIVGAAGGSGGGGIFISLYGTDSSGPTPTAGGGAQGNYYADTNAGGAGTGIKAAL